ncbi:MAG: ABC transporter substrate-binding protein, partial [Prochlorococcus sp.]
MTSKRAWALAILLLLTSFALVTSWALILRPIQVNILMPASIAKSTAGLVRQFNNDHHGYINL